MRIYGTPKRTVDEVYKLDLKDLAKGGRFRSGERLTCTWSRGEYENAAIEMDVVPTGLWFHYTLTDGQGQEESMGYVVCLKTTPCSFGGVRYWFVCPGCGAGCRILYLPYNGNVFACRRCCGLVYPRERDS